MMSRSWSCKSIAFCLAIAILSVCPTVALTRTGQTEPSGELSVSGQVTVNGHTATSGATVLSDSTVATAQNSSATIILGKLGRVELLPNSSMKVSFNETSINGMHEAGRVRISVPAGVAVNITTKDGSVIGKGKQAAAFTIDLECGNTIVATQAGLVELHAAGKVTDVAAGQDAVAGVAQPGTRCTRIANVRGFSAVDWWGFLGVFKRVGSLLHSKQDGEIDPCNSLPALALIETITFKNQKITQVSDSEVQLTRYGLNKPLKSFPAGVKLCKGDKVAIIDENILLALRFSPGQPGLNIRHQQDLEVIVYPKSEFMISSFWLSVGSVLVRIKGYFRARTPAGGWSSSSTEYEVKVERGSDSTSTVPSKVRADITVLDGEVCVNDNNAANNSISPPCRPGPILQTGEEIVQKLQRATLIEDEPVNPPRLLSPAEQRAIVERTSNSILATAPDYPAEGIILHFDSQAERAKQFLSTRFTAILDEDPRSYEVLGDIYSDWADGAQAIEAYENAIDRYKERDPSWQASASFLTNIGEAYRIAGRFQQAQDYLKKALAINSQQTSALNALGNIYANNVSGYPPRGYNNQRDKAYLLRAKIYYEGALQTLAQGPSTAISGAENKTRAIVETNLGKVLLALGYIAQQEGLISEAKSLYQDSERAFRSAQGLYPGYPYALIGLGQVYNEEGNLARKQGDKSLGSKNYELAEKVYEQVRGEYPDFPVVYVTLGNLYKDRNDKSHANKNYDKGKKLSPIETDIGSKSVYGRWTSKPF